MKTKKFILILFSMAAASSACTSTSEETPVNDAPAAQAEVVAAPILPEVVLPSEDHTHAEENISLVVIQVNYFVDSIDFLNFVGFVVNTGTVDLEHVEVNITLHDENGTLVAAESGSISLAVLPANRSAPFSIFFLNNPEGWTDYEIIANADETSFINAYTDFEIISSTGSDPGFIDYEIVGELQNTGTRDAQLVQIVAVLYDSDGDILAVGISSSELEIVEAGGTSPFSIAIIGKAEGEVADFELMVAGRPTN